MFNNSFHRLLHNGSWRSTILILFGGSLIATTLYDLCPIFALPVSKHLALPVDKYLRLYLHNLSLVYTHDLLIAGAVDLTVLVAVTVYLLWHDRTISRPSEAGPSHNAPRS